MTFGFGFCSVLYGVVLGSDRVFAHFLLCIRVRFDSFLLGLSSCPSQQRSIRGREISATQPSPRLAESYVSCNFSYTMHPACVSRSLSTPAADAYDQLHTVTSSSQPQKQSATALV